MNYLDSVNKLLKAIRVRPVASLDLKHPDVVDAKIELEAQKLALLKTGWWFNRTYNWEAQPDPTTKHIQLPTTVLAVSLSDTRDKRDYPAVSLRGNLLYNNLDDTLVFTRSLYLTVVRELDWDDLPEAAQQYIMYTAMREFVRDKISDTVRANEAGSEAQRSMMELNAEEVLSEQNNMFSNPRTAKARAGRRPYYLNNGRQF